MSTEDRKRLLIEEGQLWASTAQIAHRFGRSTQWVDAHRQQLGGARLSPGASNSEWTFLVSAADGYMLSLLERATATDSTEPRRRAARKPKLEPTAVTRTGAPLLSFR